MTALTSAALDTLQREASAALPSIVTGAALEAWRIKYLGRKGALPTLLRQLKDLPADQRRQLGAKGNALRQELEQAFQRQQSKIEPAPNRLKLQTTPPAADYKLQTQTVGHLHPLTRALNRARHIFAALGFQIIEGPDIEEAKYNFDQLNIDFEHPARAETDTFYLENLPDLVLRTHVSSLQVRGVIEQNIKPPFKLMYYGPSFRSEKEDPTHLSHFQQYEFMVVDEKVNLADLKAIVQTFYSLFFGRPFAIRFRPAYYPFVEPGLDVDMRDSVTKKSAWLEMAGAGLVHPNVLRNIGVDPNKYQGIALGGGLDRLVMLESGIPDARLLYQNDLRFLQQFP